MPSYLPSVWTSTHPQLLSTSRHIMQGLIDVKLESWDPAARILSGTSAMVAGDAYELRLVCPEDLSPTNISVNETDRPRNLLRIHSRGKPRSHDHHAEKNRRAGLGSHLQFQVKIPGASPEAFQNLNIIWPLCNCSYLPSIPCPAT